LAQGTGITLFCTPQEMNLNMAAFGTMDKTGAELGSILSKPRPVSEKKRLD